MKYTDMAIYIDKNLPLIKEPDKYPEVETKIYEYLYHILFALSMKAGYFKVFDDYDSFACYGACELFFSMRKKLINEGKEVRGKKIIPVKSSLNFIKATMFPLKVNYQRESFMQVLDPELHESVDMLKTNVKEDIQASYRRSLYENLTETVDLIPKILSKVLALTPFRYDQVMCRKLQISILLTLLDDITMPNKLRKKFDNKKPVDNADKALNKLIVAYELNPNNVILWHLDDGYAPYVRLLTQRLKRWIGNELQVTIHSDDLSDGIIDSIINSAYETHNTDNDTE
jgi:hypothetical protein